MKLIISLVFIIGSIIASVAILKYNKNSGFLYGLKLPLIIIGSILSIIVLISYVPMFFFIKREIISEIIAFIIWFAPSFALLITGILLKRKS
jgi:hypothetical protein